ncbi:MULTISPECIES: SchA/CurD-like domain-containing protein [unclassified Streptomyces]|uniref:SchA/CurD-like domain-containing protein n=1 Tax=unclassified Streptomyces TaxID=2593676 RepID=UPI002E1DB79F|nr:SchA/CurD [Streptomyces sp. NBC_01023]
MATAAITYKIKPGFEEEIAEIFSASSFKRAGSPIIRDEDGNEVGRITATSLFIKDDRMVRFITFEGTLEDVGRHMAGQDGVQEAEHKLAPYLAEPRDTTTVEGFLTYFRNSSMRVLSQLSVDSLPPEILAKL